MDTSAILCLLCGVSQDAHDATTHPWVNSDNWGSPGLKRSVQFALAGADPGQSTYITLEDKLAITLINMVAGIEVDVGVRLELPDGQIIPMFFPLFPLATRVAQTFLLGLAEGFLLSVDVSTPTAAVRKGACFCNMSLARGTSTAPQYLNDLTEGYVVTGNDLGWPWPDSGYSVDQVGQLRSIQVSNPAVGNDWVTTVPTGARWQILGGYSVLTTSSTAGGRDAEAKITDGAGNILFLGNQPFGQALSTTATYGMQPGVSGAGSVAGAILGLPDPTYLLQGWTIGTSTINLSATDQWSAISLWVMEWLEL